MEKKLIRLMSDFGYHLQGKLLIEDAVFPYYPARIIGRTSGAFDACEQLIPILRDDDFYKRFKEITSLTN